MTRTPEVVMKGMLLLAAGTVLAVPPGLAGQDTTRCSGEAMVLSVVLHEEAPIEGLTVWRGTTPSPARPPAWREISCAPIDVETSAPEAPPEMVPEGWGVPDLSAIEALVLGSPEVRELNLRMNDTAGPESLALAGNWAYVRQETQAPLGFRAIFMDPGAPDRPLHLVVEEASPTVVRVLVESSLGPLGLAWERSTEDPTWRRTPLTS